MAEILAFSANFPKDLLATVKAIPRLAGTGRPSYQDDVSKDWTCIRLQEQNDIGEKREAKEGIDKIETSWRIIYFFYRNVSPLDVTTCSKEHCQKPKRNFRQKYLDSTFFLFFSFRTLKKYLQYLTKLIFEVLQRNEQTPSKKRYAPKTTKFTL